MSQKWEKSQAGYVHLPKTQYECQMCRFFNGARESCEIVSGVIHSWGTCNNYVPKIQKLNQQEAGYCENPARVGYSCKRCSYFSPEKNDCEVVDKNSPGDAPGTIHPDGCCDHQESDRVRGRIPTMAFALHQIKK